MTTPTHPACSCPGECPVATTLAAAEERAEKAEAHERASAQSWVEELARRKAAEARVAEVERERSEALADACQTLTETEADLAAAERERDAAREALGKLSAATRHLLSYTDHQIRVTTHRVGSEFVDERECPSCDADKVLTEIDAALSPPAGAPYCGTCGRGPDKAHLVIECLDCAKATAEYVPPASPSDAAKGEATEQAPGVHSMSRLMGLPIDPHAVATGTADALSVPPTSPPATDECPHCRGVGQWREEDGSDNGCLPCSGSGVAPASPPACGEVPNPETCGFCGAQISEADWTPVWCRDEATGTPFCCTGCEIAWRARAPDCGDVGVCWREIVTTLNGTAPDGSTLVVSLNHGIGTWGWAVYAKDEDETRTHGTAASKEEAKRAAVAALPAKGKT